LTIERGGVKEQPERKPPEGSRECRIGVRIEEWCLRGEEETPRRELGNEVCGEEKCQGRGGGP